MSVCVCVGGGGGLCFGKTHNYCGVVERDSIRIPVLRKCSI